MTIVNKFLSLLRKEDKDVNFMQPSEKSVKINEDYEVKILALIGSFIAYEWIGSGFEDEFKSNLTKEDTLPLSIDISKFSDSEDLGDCEVIGKIKSDLNDLEITIKSIRKMGYLISFSVTIDQINGKGVNLSFNHAPFYNNPGLTMIDITKKVTEDISLLFNKDQ